MRHSFFRRIDWAQLRAQKSKPPGKPDLHSPTDLSYFERMSDEIPGDDDELMPDPDGTLFKWCENF